MNECPPPPPALHAHMTTATYSTRTTLKAQQGPSLLMPSQHLRVSNSRTFEPVSDFYAAEKRHILISMYKIFSTYLAETMKIPALLDGRFYLNLLRFVDGQMSSMTFVATDSDRAITELCYLPLYQMMWETVHSATRPDGGRKLLRCDFLGRSSSLGPEHTRDNRG